MQSRPDGVNTLFQPLCGPFSSFRVKPSVPTRASSSAFLLPSSPPAFPSTLSLSAQATTTSRTDVEHTSTLPGPPFTPAVFTSSAFLPGPRLRSANSAPRSAQVSVQMSLYRRDLSRLESTRSLSMYDQYSLCGPNPLPYFFLFFLSTHYRPT